MDGFEWNEDKRQRNIEDHGVDFRLAALIFKGPVLDADDERDDYGETRYRALGRVGDEYLVLACPWGGANRRIISAWKVDEHGKKDTKQYSLDELEKMISRGDYLPTRSDAPEVELDKNFWRNARVVVPPGKKSIHLRVDADVLAWFNAQGRGYLTRMNAVLRSYMEAHKQDRM